MAAWLHEKAAIVATIDPADQNGVTANSDYVDMSLYHEVMAILQVGVTGAATGDFKARQATSTAGADEADISGKAITQIASGAGDAGQYIISLRADEMTMRYVRFRLTVGGASWLGAVLVLGVPRFAPGTDADLSTVTEIIT